MPQAPKPLCLIILRPTCIVCMSHSVHRPCAERARLEFRHPRRLREMQCHSTEISAMSEVFPANICSDSRNLTWELCVVLCTSLTTCRGTDGRGLTVSNSDGRPKGEKQWENAFIERAQREAETEIETFGWRNSRNLLQHVSSSDNKT